MHQFWLIFVWVHFTAAFICPEIKTSELCESVRTCLWQAGTCISGIENLENYRYVYICNTENTSSSQGDGSLNNPFATLDLALDNLTFTSQYEIIVINNESDCTGELKCNRDFNFGILLKYFTHYVIF